MSTAAAAAAPEEREAAEPAAAAAPATAADVAPPSSSPAAAAAAAEARQPPATQRPRLFVYEFTLAHPPHPPPEDVYAPHTPPEKDRKPYHPYQNHYPQNQYPPSRLLPYDGSRRHARLLLPLAQRYARHAHASGHPCTNCGETHTSTWRRLNPTRELSCNSCSDSFRRHGRYRPVPGLPARVMGADLVAEGDTWGAMCARARAFAAEEAGKGGGGGEGGNGGS